MFHKVNQINVKIKLVCKQKHLQLLMYCSITFSHMKELSVCYGDKLIT